MVNKKALAQQTIGELIMVLGGGIIGLVILMAIFSPMFPIIGTIGCTANIGLYAFAVSNSGGWLTTPIFLCNQYREPVKINAADFNACPGLAGFCKNAKDLVKDECYKQCARIQIDKFADSCWAMGGKGLKELGGAWWQQDVGAILQSGAAELAGYIIASASVAAPAAAGIVAAPATGGVSLIPGLGSAAILAGEYGTIQNAIKDTIMPKKNVLLKCNKFQIVNPALTSYRRPFVVEDASGGKGDYAIQGDVCRDFGLESPCYLGGSGMSAVTQTEIRPEETYKLYYEAQARQVCYISYQQYRNNRDQQGNSVVRHCATWAPYGGATKTLN